MSQIKKSHAELFRQQKIDLDHPGTVLRDFETVLDAFGTEGLRAPGPSHLLPPEVLVELDSRMTRPLRLRMTRPQQASYPHLNGLYLLLRATQLAVPQGASKTSGRLVLDPVLLESWRSLNFTEQYFNLLEAWLLRGSPSLVGDRNRGYRGELAILTKTVWGLIGEKGLQVRNNLRLNNLTAYCMLALMELFGLAHVEHGEPAEGKPWRILAVRRTPFGEAVLETVLPRDQILPWDLGTKKMPRDFGVWQPVFQKYFPEWRNNLRLPETEFRDGVYYFKVTLGFPWRRIAIPARNTLDDLAWAIIKAYRFDGDHLYEFRFRQRDGAYAEVSHPYVDDADFQTDEFSIGDLPLQEGQSMVFLYDFGASWKFNVTLEKIEPPNRQMKKPRVVESHGKPPAEY